MKTIRISLGIDNVAGPGTAVVYSWNDAINPNPIPTREAQRLLREGYPFVVAIIDPEDPLGSNYESKEESTMGKV